MRLLTEPRISLNYTKLHFSQSNYTEFGILVTPSCDECEDLNREVHCKRNTFCCYYKRNLWENNWETKEANLKDLRKAF